MTMHIIDIETGAKVNPRKLMKLAGLNPGLGYEDFGVQSDGTPVIFDRCGGFGYLDCNKYRVVIDILAE